MPRALELRRALRRSASVNVDDGFVFGDGVAEQLRDHDFAEAFDVHHGARGEVAQLFFEARGATGVDAAVVDLALFADHRSARSAGSAWGRRSLRCRAHVSRPRRLRVILGMTSPPRSTWTKSPMRTPRRAISSALCSVARVTVVPPMKTGASTATGVSLPVRPTWKSDAVELRDAGARGEFIGDGPARGLAGEAERGAAARWSRP